MRDKWGAQTKINQACADLIASADFHSQSSFEADLFTKFLSEEYDQKDLIFFLYLRKLLEKELKVKFSLFGTVSGRQVTEIRTLELTYKQCHKLSSIFFDTDSQGHDRFLTDV